MRRSLVLTREGARHSFRANLPTKVPFWQKKRSISTHAAVLSLNDVRGFVNVYLAGVAAVLAFIM